MEQGVHAPLPRHFSTAFHPAPHAPGAWQALAFWGGVAALVLAAASVAWACDDAYVTLRTVDNLHHGFGLRWNVAERVQAYTHPLWMLLLAALYPLASEPFYLLVGLGLALSAAFYALLLRAARPSPALVVALVAAGLASNALTDFATSGLENPLSNVLLALFVGTYLDRDAQDPRRLGALALLTALLFLTRPDSAVLTAAPLAEAAWSARGTRRFRALLAGLSPAIAWECFSIVYYGFPFANTAYAKVGGGVSGVPLLDYGIRYIRHAFVHDPVTPVVIVVAIVVGLCMRTRRSGVLAGALVLDIAYVLSIGGDFMAGRFLVAPFAVSLCMLARQRPPPAIALAALPLIAGIAFAGHWRTEAFGGVPRTAVIELVDGIANERAFYGPGMSLRGVLADGGGPRNGWRVIGTGLRDDRAPLSLAGNVGLLGYYAGPGVHIVDVFGLTDPLTARLAVRNPAARIGHFGREPPSGYMRSLETGTNAIVQPDLARYYAALRNVVSGPLASSARVADVVSVNAGAARAALAAFERKGDAPQRADALTLADGAGDAQACAKCLYLSSAGVVVGFADAVRPATLEVTLDRAGRYEVQWQLQGSAVATEIIEATSAANAMGTVTVGAQRGAVRYDTVRLRPLDGYGGYRLAALRAVGS